MKEKKKNASIYSVLRVTSNVITSISDSLFVFRYIHWSENYWDPIQYPMRYILEILCMLLLLHFLLYTFSIDLRVDILSLKSSKIIPNICTCISEWIIQTALCCTTCLVLTLWVAFSCRDLLFRTKYYFSKLKI